MTIQSVRPDLLTALGAVTTWLNSTSLPTAWTYPQGEKWTIEQEFDHVLYSTYGIVLLFSDPGRANWRPADRPSRTYDEIVTQYDAAVRQLPPSPVVAREAKSLTKQNTAWHQTLAAIDPLLPTLTSANLTDNTVWKHPVLGPVTGLEMLYFSVHHTYHHLATMKKKQAAVVLS